MTERNHIHDSVVLRSKESPAGDRILTLMTADSGLVDVFVFGGGKSKLRSLASPYVHGKAFVYADPVKDYRKLSDFEVVESFSDIRLSLDRLWGASVIAEMLLRSSGGGGDFDIVSGLTLDALRALEWAEDDRAAYPVVLFLWRLLALIGLGPDIHFCAACGRALTGDESGGSTGRARTPTPVFDPSHEGLLCMACASRADTDFEFSGGQMEGLTEWAGRTDAEWAAGRRMEISPGALRWLERAEGLPFEAALRAGLDKTAMRSLEAFVYSLARRAAEAPLYTLEGR